MRFEFIADEHVKVKTFLKKHEVSKDEMKQSLDDYNKMFGTSYSMSELAAYICVFRQYKFYS